MLWSIIDSCQNRVHNVSADQCQMTVSQTQDVQLIEVTCFFKVLSWPHIVFLWIAGSGPFFQEDFCLLLVYGES